MSKTIKPHVKKVDYRNNPSDNKTVFESVGAKLTSDTNPTVSALGAGISTAATTLNGKIVASKDAHDAALVATKTMNDSNTAGCKTYNDAGLIVEQQYPDNPTKWLELGLEVTKDLASTKEIPDKCTNCSMAQGEFPKACTIDFDPSNRAENYTIEITKDNPSGSPVYILVRNPKTVYSTSSINFNMPDDYLNVPVWIKVTAHNTTGNSPASDPFGGMRIQ